ncbi:hypothetical protein [Rathayibacter tanaceti]|uniref:Uncharacterized protein n=2 Tax=Rathayibacter tanaceti TaxID=1671680 RepID=A0A162GIQ1_9MICO|nr:hypothetical protein [Rathayibacter tanaceti]KZX21829.1 hypothetical protein ACH61_01041 [Rathayibacter tanaceti]QHC56736.1 hypothetical protein GSU10_14605 [Rathayibacter tanaceti]TCO32970.1 hypothetical protein EV639_11512 [Rathayibacter tanaceti]
MQKLYYASGYVLLGDEVCGAVVEYAQALANVSKSDFVVVPSLSDEGLRGETRLLIGPASQLFSGPVLDRGVDLDDPAVVESMREKTRRLQPARPTIQARSEDDDDETDYF